MNPWVNEAPLVDEVEFSGKWTGFNAWNIMSPELEFCNVAKYVTKSLHDTATIIETGLGQGYVTRRVLSVMKDTQRLITFDHQERWLDMVENVPPSPQFSYELGQPGYLDMVTADFVILDSEPSRRKEELSLWFNHSPPHSMLLVHDTFHDSIEDSDTTRFIKRHNLQGWWFDNPRGSFLGVHGRVKNVL